MGDAVMRHLWTVLWLSISWVVTDAQAQSNNPAEQNPLVRHCLEHPEDCARPTWSPSGMDPAHVKALDASINRVYEAWKKAQGVSKSKLPTERFRTAGPVKVHDKDRARSKVTATLKGGFGGLSVSRCKSKYVYQRPTVYWCRIGSTRGMHGRGWVNGRLLRGELTGMPPYERKSDKYRARILAVTANK